MRQLLLYIFCICYVNVASASVEKATLYGVPEAFYLKWESIVQKSTADPKQSLVEFNEEKARTTLTDKNKAMFVEMVYISILVNQDHSNQAIQRIQAALQKATELEHVIYKAALLSLKATILKNAHQYDQALIDIEQALAIHLLLNYARAIGQDYLTKGHILLSQKKLEPAFLSFLNAYNMLKNDTNSSLISSTLLAIAAVYDLTGEHHKSIEYYLESLAYIDKKNQPFHLSITYYNIALAYGKLKQYEKKHQYLLDALALSKQLQDELGIAYAEVEIADIHIFKQDYLSAIKYAENALKIFEKNRDSRMVGLTQLVLSSALIHHKNIEQASVHLEKAQTIFKESPELNEELKLLEVTAQLAQAKGKFEEALLTTQQFMAVKEKQFLQNQLNTLNLLKVQFDLQSKEAQNKLLAQKNVMQGIILDNERQQKNIWLVLSILSIVSIICIGYMLFKQIQIKKRFRRLAMTDELTKAPNRRSILAFTKMLLKHPDRVNNIFVAIIDLDYFKKINDIYGHDVGDKVLKAFYQAASHSINVGDRVGRLGGEEWLLTLVDLNEDSIQPIFERITNVLNKIIQKQIQMEKPITFSMGIVNTKAFSSLEDILKQADKNLYQAKANGRHQWVISH
ncbi:diguanylate cyclase [Aliikangiella maris]|uniref:Tetratricopeptide repeat-containing diguanylate cyclase n=2 Tax=Aliikangiella maris TaxID=3162458 RepID=A0ABV3MPG0_9GAMM